jgi:hypothetical protein
MNGEARINEFVEWFRTESNRLNSLSPKDAANEIGDRLLIADERLGVEIGSDDAAPREIILTAFSDSSAFSLVRDIVEKLGPLPGWNVIALKPPRGFDFSLAVAGQEIDAARLSFKELSGARAAFELISPGSCPTGEGAEEAAWLIVETGIGEELAACISHLEFGCESGPGKRRPINELARHVLRIARRS